MFSRLAGGLSTPMGCRFRAFLLLPLLLIPAAVAEAQSAPAKPTGLTATAQIRSVRLSWTNPNNSDITGWQYRRGTGDPVSWGSWTNFSGSFIGTTISRDIPRLTSGTEYSFQVRALAGTEQGAASDTVSATPLAQAAAPAKPAGLAATAGRGQVTLNWTDPSNAAITVWQFRQRTPPDAGSWGGWEAIASSTAATTTHTVTGLTSGTAYEFQIRARAGLRPGPASDAVSATPLAANAPAKPTGLTATAGNQQVTLSWTDPKNSDITKYQYRQGTGDPVSWGGWTDFATSDATTTTRAIDGLTNGTEYSFQIRAVAGTEFGAMSDTVSETPNRPPARPTGLTATTGDASGEVDLSWTDPDDDTITSYSYQFRVGGGRWMSDPIPASDADTTSYTVTGLTDGTEYEFRIVALVGSIVSSASASATATPLNPAGPAKPTGLTATAGNQLVTLSWTDPKNSDITKYQYRQGTGDPVSWGGWTDFATSDATTTTRAIDGLTNGTEYSFQIRAVAGTEFGAMSDTVSETPNRPPARPTGLTATTGDASGEVDLSWTDPDDDTITSYSYQFRVGGGRWMSDPIPASDADTTSYTVTGLTDGTEYEFRIVARLGSIVSSPSASATATPLNPAGPAKPTGLTATAGNTRVDLSWTAPSGTITGYEVRRGTGSPVVWGAWAATGSTTASYAVTGLTNGTAYSFQVRAVNNTVLGAMSDTVSATPAPPEVSVAIVRGEGLSVTPGGALLLAEDVALGTIPVQFRVSASPTPATDLTVCVSIAETGVDRVAASAEGAKTVTITGGNATVDYSAISWTDNNVDDRNSLVTMTVVAPSDSSCSQTGYTVSSSASSGSFLIEDNERTSLALSSTDMSMTEEDTSDTAVAAVTLGRRLYAGETLVYGVGLSTTTGARLPDGDASTPEDFTVAVSGTGVTATGLDTASPVVTFTGHDTNTVQVATLTFTPTAGTDTDGADEAVRVGFGSPGSATNVGGGAAGTGNVDLTIDDSVGLVLSATTLTVAEGGSGTYTVALASQPTATVTVTVGGASGDVTVDTDTSTPNDQNTLTFTTGDWNTAQTVTVSADEDGDTTNDSATLTHSASGGDYAGLTGDNVVVTVTDDDAPGLVFDPTALTVMEGGSGTYTVRLATEPSASVTVTVAGASGDVTVDTDPDNDGDQTTLTFTTSTWNTAKTVTVSADEDNDGVNDEVTLTHSASGGGYGSVTGNVSVTVTDNDTPGLTLNPTSLTVTEGGSGTYTVRLATEPSASVTVTVAGASGDVTVDTDPDNDGDQTTLTFTTGDWNTAQTVTVSADEDDDTANDSATLTHSASGGGYGSVTGNVEVTVTDNDTPGLTLNPTSLTVTEGGSGTYTVRLATEPSASVTVTVAGASGDVTVDTDPDNDGDQTTLTFTTGDWNTAQTVTVSADEDDDTANDSATLTHTASGGGYGSVTGNVVVTVEDDDTVGVTTATTDDTATEGSTSDTATFTVVLNTQPSDNVAVTVTAPAGLKLAGPGGSTFSGSALIAFTASTWGTAQTVTVRATDDNTDSPIGRELSVTYSTSSRDNNYHSLSGDAATVTVVDDDATTVTLAGSAGNIEEGETKTFTVTLGRGLVNGETLPVPLTFTGGATRGTDYTTACQATLPTGVTCANLDSGNAMVTFTGPSTGTTSRTVTLTLSAATDNTAETGGETVMIGLGTLSASSGTGLGGGASGTGSLSFSITDPSATDTTVPTLTISGVPGTISTRAAFTANFTFSESVTDFDTNDITVTGGSKGTLSGSGRSYRMQITPTGGVNVVVTVRRNAATDGTNRGPAAAVSRTATWRAPSPPPQQPPAEEDDDDDPPSSGGGGGGGGSTPSLPSASLSAVSVSAGQMVIEGGEALFRITASPVPSDEITVRVRVSATGDFVDGVQLGERLVTLSASAPTASLRVATIDDRRNEADGTVTVTVLSGEDYRLSQASASLAVTDDDTPALVLTPETLTVDEGGSGNYRVALATEPAGDVTVSIAGTGEVTTAQNTLTFTAGNWSTAQPVTVSAGQDADAADDRARLDHRASGGGYDSVTGSVTVTVTDDDTPGLILTPAALTLAEGASASYTVALATEPTGNVTVSIAGTGDVTVDRSTLSFTARNWSAAQTVTLFAARDEDVANDSATLAHHARGGDYSSVTGSVEVTVTDAGAAVVSAHLARFGRTVAEQALDGIAGRLRAPRTAGMQKTLAGPRLNVPREGDTAQGTMHAEARRTGFENEYESQSRDLLHLPNAREMLLGSSFTLTTQEAEGTGGSFAFWGRASANRFDGATNDGATAIGLDGEVLTGLVGADYARGDWLFGLALTHSLSEGGYTSEGANAGKVDASLTAALPYLSLQANPRLKLWGAGGYGIGEVTLKTGGASYRADTDWTMAAAGVRGDLLDAAGNRPAVAVIGDGLWMRSTSDEIAALSTADTFVTRLRLGVEASYDFNFDGMGDLTPRVEAGARHDGGDAETGAGMDLGVGINWKAPVFGLSLDVAGRMLILHENEDFADRGISAAVVFDPNPESERGPSLSLRQAIGGSADGGIEALFATTTPLGDGGQIGSGAGMRRTLETAYGFSAFGGRFTASPHAEVDFTERARDYALGWRFVPHKLASDLAFGIKATRREAETLAPVHVFGVEATVRW